ncbi:hypothetical protein [Halomonas mongoliensis]|uniref:hypothetical protein n=1 Tax=Halomonas mongoliensis TaxID=321265 RepID=UPI00403B1732
MSSYFLSFVSVLGVGFSSVYVFPSGMPQPADFILLLFSFLTICKFTLRARIPFPFFFALFSILVLWIFLVSVVWSFILQSFRLLHNPLFYLYNFMVSFAFYLYVSSSRDNFNIFRIAVVSSVLLSGVGVAINIGSGGRVTGFFNNPNQLAYFSLLGASLTLLLYRFSLPLFSWGALAVCASVIGVLSAASLGAMAGLSCVLVAYIMANISSLRRFFKLAVIVPVVFLVFLLFDFSSGGIVQDNLISRFDRMESKVDDVYGERRYDRIAAFPEYWLLGAGEGHYERFYPFDGHEIHSTFGNLFFSYGIVGLSIFLVIIGFIFMKSPLYVSLAISGPLVYSLTHMGSRTTFFWLLLMVAWYSYVYKDSFFRKKELKV